MCATVYLADLRHNYAGVLATDCMPVGVAYMKAVMDRDVPEVQSQVFAYPDRLLEAMKAAPPDVLMLTNYVWNEAISLHFAGLAKRLNPKALVVMGGPNMCIEPERQMEFVGRHPQIDIYVLGEGDFVAADLVRRFLEVGLSIGELGTMELPSCVYRRPNGEVIRHDILPRERAVDEIPSPWLTGIMDQFFDGKLAPMIETNRGCPFRCSFCVQGTSYYNQINHFGLERLREEIDYIGSRIKTMSPAMGTLRIADANYGMYERDVTISGYIAEAQKKYGWPTFIDATTGKNRPERIIRSMEQVNGALVLYQAVQSLDEDVLRNVRRSNIKLEAYEKIQMHIRGRGLRSNSDLILGLPGESLRSHVQALQKIVDAGTNQMHCFQAMMLKGSDMESVASRKQYRFDTRFRVLPKNFGEYDGQRVFDIEEIVVATDTLPFEDYLEARQMHLTFSVFYNDGWFGDVVESAGRNGISRWEWLDAMLAAMKADDGEVGRFLGRFVDETRNELFPTPESCADFYNREENFQRLMKGDIGDNLMYKYRAIASFHLWPEICRLAMDTTRGMFVDRGIAPQIPDFETFWGDFSRYVELKHAHGTVIEQVLKPMHAELHYDIDYWLSDGAAEGRWPARMPDAREFEFQLTEEAARELKAAFTVWTNGIKGLTKMVTRIRTTAQVRQCRPVPVSASQLRV
jgi:radical SAM superfamily enzyme YgiQ (UPF0313 family)